MTKSEKNRWNTIKSKGSAHYKSQGVEPIDLYKEGKMLRDFSLCSIMKYAYRNRREEREDMNIKDLDKIIHYAEILKAIYMEEEKEKMQRKEKSLVELKQLPE